MRPDDGESAAGRRPTRRTTALPPANPASRGTENLPPGEWRSAPGRGMRGVATITVLLFFGGFLWPPLFIAAATLGAVGLCGLALVRRPSPALRVAILGVGAWALLGLGAAWLLRESRLGAPAFVLIVLFAVPLPLIPWLYARTFDGRAPERSDAPRGGDAARGGHAPVGRQTPTASSGS